MSRLKYISLADQKLAQQIETSQKNFNWNLRMGKKYSKNIYKELTGYVGFDQPLLWGQHLDIWPKVFDPFKAIYVYRDPLDQLAGIIRISGLIRGVFSNIGELPWQIYMEEIA